MKTNKFSEISAYHTRVLFAAAAITLVPFVQTASAGSVIDYGSNFSTTFASNTNGNGGSELPDGFTAVIGGATPSIAFTGPSGLPNSTVLLGGSVSPGFYFINNLNQSTGNGVTGVGMATGADPLALVLGLYNNPNTGDGDSYGSVNAFYTAQVFRDMPAGVDVLNLQFMITTSPLTTAAQFTDAAGWTPTVLQTFPGAADGTQISGGAANIPLLGTWDPGEYLYVRFFDTTAASKGIAFNNASVTGNVFVAVPEPSTWVAAGLLLGCVGYSSIRRKAKVDAEVLSATVA